MQTAHFCGLFIIDNFPPKLTTNPVKDSQHDYIRQNSESVDLFLIADQSTFSFLSLFQITCNAYK